jgi:flagellar export protein FliJ
MRTRLDAVVQVRERAEEKALRQVVEVETQARAAIERAEALKKVALQDQRQPGDAATWELAESAHVRALTDARRAQKEAERIQAEVSKVRIVYTSAHQRAEVVRRVAETRRDEQRREVERVEEKALDEVASLLWYRKAG